MEEYGTEQTNNVLRASQESEIRTHLLPIWIILPHSFKSLIDLIQRMSKSPIGGC